MDTSTDRYRDVIHELAVAAGTRQLDMLAVRAVETLAVAGLDALVLRGPAVARTLYDQPGERPYNDVDLMVQEQHLEEAKTLIESLGLRELMKGSAESEKAPHAITYVGERGSIDLHWTLRGVAVPPAQVWDVLARDARPLALEPSGVMTPGPAGLALTLALHAAQHGPQGQVQLEDVRRAVQRLPGQVWRDAQALAEELGAANWFARGLSTADDGGDLLEELGLRVRGELDLEIRAEGDRPIIRGLVDLTRAPGLSAKLALLLRELFPSPAFMRRWAPFTRTRPGLILGYLVRPFWLVWQLPGGLVVYRRARRRARGS